MSRTSVFAVIALSFIAGCEVTSSPENAGTGSQSPQPQPGQPSDPNQPEWKDRIPQPGEVRYLSLGDSLSQGVGAVDEKTGSFPALLAAKWRSSGCVVELNNPAISGYTAANVVDDQLSHVDQFKPTIITLEVGANDVAQGVSIEFYRAAVQTILDRAKASGARVVVMPQNEWFRSPEGQTYGTDLAERRAAFDEVIIEETKARGAEFVDLRPMFKDHADKDMWIDDGIHPTPEAYEAWATELARLVPAPCKK